MRTSATPVRFTLLFVFAAASSAAAAELVFSDRFFRLEQDDSVEELGRGWRTNSDEAAGGRKQADLDGGRLVITRAPGAKSNVYVDQDVALDDGRVLLRFKLGLSSLWHVDFVDPALDTAVDNRVCSVHVATDNLSVEDQMNGSFNKELRARRTAGEDVSEIIARYSASKPVVIDPDEWHTLDIRFEGDTATAILDETTRVTHRAPGFDYPNKAVLSFSVPTRVEIEDVRVWRGRGPW